MKRQEKQRAKAERRAQKKLDAPQDGDIPMEPLTGPIFNADFAVGDADDEV